MKKLILALCLVGFAFQSNAETSAVIEINMTKNAQSNASCNKLLSPLSTQKALNFVFSDNYQREGDDITVSYKNLSLEERKVSLNLIKKSDEFGILIKKGIFKDLYLKLTYQQKNKCEVKGSLSWKGEEKRFPKTFLVYIIDHYFDKLMSFINRLT